MVINSLEEGYPWSSVLIYFLPPLGLVALLLACGAYIIFVGYRAVVEYFSEAWKGLL